MKVLRTDLETATSWSPYKVETKRFLQDSQLEVYTAFIKGIVGESYQASRLYVVNGCELTNAGKDLAFGFVFQNGSMYSVSGFTGSTSTPIKLLLTDTASAFADPTTFSDGTVHDIHINHTFTALDSTAAVYTWTTNDFTYLNIALPLTLLNSWATYTALTPKYKRIGSDVLLQGAITKTVAGGIMFVVPAPSIQRIIPCTTINNTVMTANHLYIDTSGNATVYVTAGAGATVVMLDGLMYSL